MKITRETVAHQLAAYLRHEISLDDLVVWANTMMMDGDFDEAHYNTIRDVIARLGVADVRAFGLTWEDCESLLKQLGYNTCVEIVAA